MDNPGLYPIDSSKDNTFGSINEPSSFFPEANDPTQTQYGSAIVPVTDEEWEIFHSTILPGITQNNVSQQIENSDGHYLNGEGTNPQQTVKIAVQCLNGVAGANPQHNLNIEAQFRGGIGVNTPQIGIDAQCLCGGGAGINPPQNLNIEAQNRGGAGAGVNPHQIGNNNAQYLYGGGAGAYPQQNVYIHAQYRGGAGANPHQIGNIDAQNRGGAGAGANPQQIVNADAQCLNGGGAGINPQQIGNTNAYLYGLGAGANPQQIAVQNPNGGRVNPQQSVRNDVQYPNGGINNSQQNVSNVVQHLFGKSPHQNENSALNSNASRQIEIGGSSGTSNRGPILDNPCVYNNNSNNNQGTATKDIRRSSEKRPFIGTNYQSQSQNQLNNNSHYHQSKYQAIAGPSNSSNNVQTTPNMNTDGRMSIVPATRVVMHPPNSQRGNRVSNSRNINKEVSTEQRRNMLLQGRGSRFPEPQGIMRPAVNPWNLHFSNGSLFDYNNTPTTICNLFAVPSDTNTDLYVDVTNRYRDAMKVFDAGPGAGSSTNNTNGNNSMIPNSHQNVVYPVENNNPPPGLPQENNDHNVGAADTLPITLIPVPISAQNVINPVENNDLPPKEINGNIEGELQEEDIQEFLDSLLNVEDDLPLDFFDNIDFSTMGGDNNNVTGQGSIGPS